MVTKNVILRRPICTDTALKLSFKMIRIRIPSLVFTFHCVKNVRGALGKLCQQTQNAFGEN